MTSTECGICVESFNKSTREPINCIKCDHVCCKACFKRYLIDPEHYLQCMACRVEFDRVSLYQRLGSSFMKSTFKEIREHILYETEKSYFPATQLIVEQEIEVERIVQEKANLDEKYTRIRKERMQPLIAFRHCADVMKVSEALDKYLMLKANVEIVDEQLEQERDLLTNKIHSMATSGESKQTRTYVLACTGQSCKGMLSNESKNQYGHFVCAICTTTTCRDCKMEIVGADDHTCDPDILKSVHLMESSSKPCPSCGVHIFKISGCDAMFCTSCHASFSWRTLRLTNGEVHNPHQAEWLRLNQNRPRETRDIQCGRELTNHIALYLNDTMIQVFGNRKMSSQERKLLDYLYDAIRVGIHHSVITIPNLSRNRYGHHTNQALRVRLLKGIINEATFKHEIQRMDKANAKRQDYLQVAMTYRDSLTDIIWEFVDQGERKSKEQWIDMIKQIKALEKYVNDCFFKISSVFGSSVVHEIMSDRSIY